MMRRILLTFLIFSLLLCNIQTVLAAPITSPFGWRNHPITGEWKFHTGLDIGYEYGDAIQALLPGIVVYSAWYGGYGNTIILEHADGDHTLYAHASAIHCSYGQYVEKGETIGSVGSSGISTGPHLHVEWWHNGNYADPLLLWD